MLDQTSDHPSAIAPSIIAVELHDYGSLGKLYEKCKTAGVRFRREPFKVDWAEETLQLEVEDPDGNVLIFWGNFGT